MQSFEETTAFLQEFENNFNPTKWEKSPIPIKILGYGEISTVLSFKNDKYNTQAYKRLPLFDSEKQASDYSKIYTEYNQLLENKNIAPPQSDAYWVKGHNGKYVAYLSQNRLDGDAIGNKIIHNHSDKEALLLFKLVLNKMTSLWQYNNENPELLLGLDCQISNWAVKNYNKNTSITENTELLFIDTSTPFIRKNSIEQMNPLLFLQSAPKPMQWILKKFFLQDVMDRYYDFRLVVIDLIANLYKEQQSDLIPKCLDLANQMGKELLNKTIEHKEIEKYYKEDKFIWQLFLGLRRADRFITTKILRKRYEFTLPGKIKR